MWKRTGNVRNNKALIILGCISTLVLAGYLFVDSLFHDNKDSEKDMAVRYMIEMIDAVSDYCHKNNIQIDKMTDPGETGLIGPEWTEITTTIGHLEAKRTSLNPEFAALMVGFFKDANLNKGDAIALGCSGSFPGLLLASLASSKAMKLNCKSIISIGASSYGANRPNLTILDIYQILIDKELVTNPPIGISLGGEADIGLEWDRKIHAQVLEKIKMSGTQFIWHKNLIENINLRADLYGFNTPQSPKIFINIGGATANIGTSPSILRLKPGLIKQTKLPPPEQQGILHIALTNNIPVIHLLYIKGLAIKYGLRWDPVN